LLKKMVVEKIAMESTDKELSGLMKGGDLSDGIFLDVAMVLKRWKGGDRKLNAERYFV